MGISRKEFVRNGAAVMTGHLTVAEVPAGQAIDYAASAHVESWLHHPAIGDPSWDTFEREARNPIHRGREPYWWPVNGTLFHDPVSHLWYAYVSVYPRGYWPPPPADVLILRESASGVWDEVGYVFGRNRPEYACGGGRVGAATDLHVAYADGKYHGVFGWCDPDNRRGGLGYAVSDRPDGPFHVRGGPIHDDAVRTPVMGRYVRAYASTLIKRKRDWIILHMMSTPGNAGGTWALFAMVGERPDGPYADPIPLLAPQLDLYHPPIAEFFPAFTRGGRVYAPATSVAMNRTYQSLFSAPIENAHHPHAWRIGRLGSMWHAEPHTWEAMGIWGQTIACVATREGILRALFAAKDRADVGGIGIARRPWSRSLRNGFVLSAPNAPAYAVLRRRAKAFRLRTAMRADGGLRVCWGCRGPLGPDHPYADSRPSSEMSRDRHELRLGGGRWSVVAISATGVETALATGELPLASHGTEISINQEDKRAVITLDGSLLWVGVCPARTGRIEIVADPASIVRVDRFLLTGAERSVEDDWLATEALSGAAAPTGEWKEVRSLKFRHGVGYETDAPGARAKWNVIGSRFTVWSPRDPAYGEAEALLDGTPVGRLDLRSDAPMPSAPVATFSAREGRHALTIVAKKGLVPCDTLTVASGI